MGTSMLRKVSLAALAIIPIYGATHTVDMRELYNEMYPVNSLKRDTFNLCHRSDATFVRALQVDRESCFDRMPLTIAIAIGRPRPGSAVAALDWSPATTRSANLFFAQAAAATLPQPAPDTLPLC